jgi:phosphatidylserine decarboxylase precursor
MSEILYKQKYLKYKKKYIELKGGNGNIYDKDGKIIKEKQPLYIKAGVWTQHLAPKFILRDITNGCIKKTKELSEEKRFEEHRKLIEEYEIDKTLIDCDEQKAELEKLLKKDHISYNDLVNFPDLQKKCLLKYKSQNDFFARKKLNLPDLNKEKINKTIVSAADSYCTMFENENESKKYWIKGTNFSIKTLLYGDYEVPTDDVIFTNNETKYVTIMRLAPGHYHRFHCPVTGTIESIYILGNAYYSVQPSIVNSRINVYSENKRCVVTIRYNNNKILKMIVVGATCVGSIQFVEKLYKNDGDIELKLLNNDNDTKLKYYDIKTNVQFSQNEELGNFNFGGSTIIYIIPKEDVISTDLTNTILSRSRNGDETSVVVGQDLYNIEDKLLNAPLSSTGVEQGKYNIISNIDDSVLAALQR